MILITRPEQDAVEMAKLLETKGYKCLLAPMLEIEYKKFEVEKYAYYIITSKHARSYVTQGGKLISIPENGKDAEAIYRWIVKNLKPKDGELVYLRGKDISVDLTLKLHAKGFDCDEAIVYEAKPVSEIRVNLDKVTLATFLSTQTLLNFCRLSDNRELPLLVLSKKIADLANTKGFDNVQVAPKPTVESLLNVIYKQKF